MKLLFLILGTIPLGLNLLAQHSNTVDSNAIFSQYQIKYFNSENGLPQNEVVDLYLSPQKFLWITTRVGLARYDGRELKWMKAPGNAGIINLDFPWFYHQKDGKVLTILGGEIPVAIKENEFDLELIKETYVDGLSFGTRGSFQFSSTFDGYKFDFIPQDSRSNYIGFEKEILFSYGKEFVKLENPLNATLDLKNCFVLNNRTFYFSPTGHVLEFINAEIDTLFHKKVFEVHSDIDKNEIIWHYGREEVFLIKNRELYKIGLREGKLHFQLIISNLPNVKIQAITFSEKDELLFLGTRKSGLMKIRKSSIVQTQIDESCHGSIDNYAIARIGEDSIINTSGVLFHNNVSPCERLFNAQWDVKNLMYDEESKFIYGTTPGGIIGVNKKQVNKTKSYFLTGIQEKGRNILKYKEKIYFTIPGIGLCGLENEAIKILARFDFETKSNSFQLKAYSDSIFYLVGNFGIAKINPTNGEYRLLDVGLFGGITSLNLYDGVIWATTYGNGILIYLDNQWRKFSPPKYEALKYSHEVIRISERIFIPTNSGFYSFNIKEVYEYCRGDLDIIRGYVFNETDGLIFNEFNGRCQNSSITTEDGNIYFPTLKGIVKFNSQLFNPYPIGERIFIEHILVNEKDSIMDINFKLDSQFENFVVKVLHPYYDNPKNAPTYYRIPEISKSWFPFNILEPIKIDRLPSGSYSLEVYITGFGLERNKKQRIIFFIVEPPFYNTPAFYAVGSFILLLLIFIVLYLIQLRAKRNRIRLENIINERTSELAESKKSVEKALNTREKMITVFSHDIRGPLAYFRQIVTEIQHKVKGLNFKGIDKELNYLHMSADASFTTADNVVNWIEGQIRLEEGEKVLINLDEEVLQIVIKRSAQFERSNIEVSFDIPSCHILMETGGMEIILNNIIQNAIKYTDSFIQIKGEINSNTEIEISIIDDGGGITDLERLEKINTGGPIASRVGKNGQLGSGLGLFMVREIINRNKGSIKFYNYKKGLKVLLVFPTIEEDLLEDYESMI